MQNVTEMAVACPDPPIAAREQTEDRLSVDAPFPWYALQIRQTRRALCEVMLAAKGVEYFSPCTLIQRQWSDRKKVLSEPLFPGYLFCSIDLSFRLPLLQVPGVIGLVSSGRKVIEIDATELDQIRRAVSSGNPVEPLPTYTVGEAVHILSGPLRGLKGVLQQVRSRSRLILSVSMLHRSIAVEISSSDLEADYS